MPTPKPAVRPGQRFEHKHFLEIGWKPDLSKGERYTDGPKARMIVTSVQFGRVYYTYDDGRNAEGAWYMDRLTFLATYADRLTEGAQP